MKKGIVILLSLALTLALTAGCAGGGSAQPPAAESAAPASEAAPAPAPEASAAPAETAEVQFFHMTWVPEMLTTVEETIKSFEADNPGIKVVETRTSWTDAPSQLMTSIMGGNPPDIIMTNPSMLAQFRSIGALADLTDRIPSELLQNVLPAGLSLCTNESGRIDSLPQEGCTWALFYRKDLFEAAGLDPNKPPTTWDELVEMGKALTKDTNGDGAIDQWGYGWPVQAENANDFWVNFMQQAGAELTTFENGGWVSKLTAPEAIEGTKFMVDLVQTHKISPTSIVDMDWEGVTNAFVSGELAMIHNGAWVVGSVKEKGPDIEGKWGTAFLFAGPDGPSYRGYPNTFHILNASTKQDQAWAFLEYFYTTPSKNIPEITMIGEYGKGANSLIFTEDYINYAKATYDPLLQPFIDNIDGCKIPPMDPQWQTLANMFVQARVQQMIMGQMSVEDGLADLDASLKKLHGE